MDAASNHGQLMMASTNFQFSEMVNLHTLERVYPLCLISKKLQLHCMRHHSRSSSILFFFFWGGGGGGEGERELVNR